LEFEGTVGVDGKNRVVVLAGKKIKPTDKQLRILWNEYVEGELGHASPHRGTGNL
jgi:hypothetical protein